MKAQTEHEITKAAMLKALRAGIRLKHQLAADREIAQKLPELESQINQALTAGRPLELQLGQVLDEV